MGIQEKVDAIQVNMMDIYEASDNISDIFDNLSKKEKKSFSVEDLLAIKKVCASIRANVINIENGVDKISMEVK